MSRTIIFCFIVISITTLECKLPNFINCSDINNLCPPNTTFINSSIDTKYDCPQALVLKANQLQISGIFSSLILIGDNIVILNLTVTFNLNITVNVSLNIFEDINIGGMILVFSNSTLFELTSIVNATITAQKIVMIGSNIIQIQSSNLTTFWNLCLYESINMITASSYIQNMIQIGNLTAISNLNFSIFMVANLDIVISSSQIEGVSFGIITFNNMSITSSNFNATALSCKTNTGLGRGAIVQFNNTYCTSGSSSCGFGVISNVSICQNIIQYFLFLSHSFPYINKGPYLSTGSGGYGYTPDPSYKGGAGGGIIFIYAENNLLIQTTNIEANGGDVINTDNLSGGSAGTVFITSKNLQGNGVNNVSARGGNSLNDKGAGGGGLIKISYQTVNLNPNYSIWININEGYQQNIPQQENFYSNGIFYGPLCPGGQQAYYLGCTPCVDNYFSTLGDPVCRACPATDQLIISTSSQKMLLSQCYEFKKQTNYLTLFTPGQINFLYISIYIATLIIFTIIGIILKKRIKKQKLLSGQQFKLDDVQKDIQKAKLLALQLRKSKDIKPYQLMYHAHRISCFGSNSQSSPWVLPSTVPSQVRKYVLPQVYCSFAQNFNKSARWSKFEYWMTIISSTIYPIYWFYLDKIKKKKYKKLTILLQNAIQYNLINNYDYEDRSIVSIKFSKNKDYTNCYLDFFIYERADLKYFNLNSPFILYLSGQGNFLRPFYLQQGDIFFRLLFFVINRELTKILEIVDQKKQLFNNMVSQKKKQKNNFQLNRFLRKLNTLACTLDLSSTNKGIIQALWNLVQFIQKWNNDFFNKLSVQIDLVVFMSKLMNRTMIDNEIQILTKKDKQQFEKLIQGKICELQQCEQSSFKIGLFVYNPQQQILKQQITNKSLLQQNQLLSNQQIQQSYLKSNLIYNSIQINKKKIHKKIYRLVRYFMMSHKNSNFDQYTIKFLQSLFILMQTMLVFIWSIKIEIPYVFINLIMPFVGIIWFVSDSYGFGKLYLIFNMMSLVNQIVTLITYSIYEKVESDYQGLIFKNIICITINICLIIFMMFLGNRAITQSKKLSLKKEDQNQPLKFQ